MVAIVTWATAAWKFGIPTSESHALIAGLSGAAIALHNGMSGINGGEWLKVVYGLVLSTLLGFVLGFIVAKLVALLFRHAERRRSQQGSSARRRSAARAAMAFMHGAQDGQKFIGVFLLGMALSSGQAEMGTVDNTHLADGAVRHRHGPGHVHRRSAASSSPWAWTWSSSKCIRAFPRIWPRRAACCSPQLTGIPVSTTHTKTTAIMGVGAARRLKSVNWSVVREMVLTWVLTFPGCGLVGFLMAKLFIAIF